MLPPGVKPRFLGDPTPSLVNTPHSFSRLLYVHLPSLKCCSLILVFFLLFLVIKPSSFHLYWQSFIFLCPHSFLFCLPFLSVYFHSFTTGPYELSLRQFLLLCGVTSLLLSPPTDRNVPHTPHSSSTLKIRAGNRPPKLTTDPNRSLSKVEVVLSQKNCGRGGSGGGKDYTLLNRLTAHIPQLPLPSSHTKK
jgi:hypothetical protein